MEVSSLLRFDKNHLWHPYAPAIEEHRNLFVKSAKGVYLHLADRKKLIDGISSWWAAIHGYNHPVLNAAISKQLQNTAHVMFGGITHGPAIELGKKLIEITPENLSHIFYSDSGSVAVEVAMKMAIQYWYAKNQPSKNRFITIKNGYHGDTWHAMSVCDPDSGMHRIFSNQLPRQFFHPAFTFDFKESSIKTLTETIEKNHRQLAGFILEPIVQGAGGMKFYHPGYLTEVKKLCETYDILFIADEIATGFGRTGKLFACEHAPVSPDIMCLGKALTGGYLPLGVTLCNSPVAETISANPPHMLLHGPTFMGNPLACAVALESINLLLKNDWQRNIVRIENHLKESLFELTNLAYVKDVRVLGAIGVVELQTAVDVLEVQRTLMRKNVWLRPFGNIIYTLPPYIITNSELQILTQSIRKTLFEVYGSG